MKTIKGPAIYLVQFLRDDEPFNNVENITKWVSSLGYKGIQVPTWDSRVFDLDKAAESKVYCDEYKDKLYETGIELVELSGHIQGQILAIHPAYLEMFEGFYPKGLNLKQSSEWASRELIKVIKASINFGTKNISTLSGSFAWHTFYPWPQRPEGLIFEAFSELVKRWKPILDMANDNGITFGFELHPGSDLFDGATYEMFLEMSGDHPSACIAYDPSHFVLQQLDYIQFIEIYGEKIKAFHIKDAEFNPSGRVGVYGGYLPWLKRAGRFRSLGDGQVDFTRVFSALTQVGFDGWAILEWECCIKSPEQGAKEGAQFISKHIIEATEVAFDDFAGQKTNKERNRRILGIE